MKKLIINSTVLTEAVKSVRKAINPNTALPVLEHVLFDIRGNRLTLTGGDLETFIQQTIGCESKESFRMVIPCRLLLDILSNIEECPLVIEWNEKNKTVTIGTDYGKFDISSQDETEYPALPFLAPDKKNPVHTFELTALQLLNIVDKLAFSMGHDELRPVMMGIYFEPTDTGLRAVSTDAHRLAVMDNITTTTGLPAFILPRSVVNILKDLVHVEGKAEIRYTAQNMIIEMDNTTVYARLIEGKYPNYRAVLPTNEQYIEIDRRALMASVKQALIVANKTTHQIRIAVTKDNIEVFGEDLDFSNEGSIRLTASTNLEPEYEIGFNGTLLNEILRNMEGEKVKLELASPNRACLMRERDNMFLLMPVVLNPRGVSETHAEPAEPTAKESEE